MTLTVELIRCGNSRVSFRGIPIQARILQGGKRGENLLKIPMTDVEATKASVLFILENKFNETVTVDWVDRTEER